MGWRIVKQPNGKYARFSDIVDDFTHLNYTEEEIYLMCRFEYDMDAKQAQQKVLGGKDDWKPWSIGIKGSGLDRWNNAIQTIEIVHGVDRAQERIRTNDG